MNSSTKKIVDASILDTIMTALEKDASEMTVTDELSEMSSGSIDDFLSWPESPQTPINAGQCFGKWRVISDKYQNPRCKEPYFLLRCECGAIRARPQSEIISGKSKSCGC